MTDFKTHIESLRNLRIPFKRSLVKIVFHIAKEHPAITLKELLEKIEYTPVKPVVKKTKKK